MRSRIHIFSLIVLFLLHPFAHAQDDTTEYEGWDIEQRCVGDVVEPSDDWTFHGEILLTGHFGIHAISNGIDTPYVVAFVDLDTSIALIDISPDKRWGVRALGYGVNTTTAANFYATGILNFTYLEVFSLDRPHDRRFISLDIFKQMRGGARPTPMPQPMWIDNEAIAFNGKIYLPFADSENAVEPDEPYYFYVSRGTEGSNYSSPDWTRQALHGSWSGFLSEIELVDMTTFEILESIPIYMYSNGLIYGRQDVAWSPDSTKFAVITPSESITSETELNPHRYLSIIDRDGQHIDHILNTNRIHTTNIGAPMQFNDEGTKLAFFVETEEHGWSLYIADLENQKSINTCHNVSHSLAWSPDGTQLALIEAGDGQRVVYVFDLETWGLYTVAHHDGSVIAWRDN